MNGPSRCGAIIAAPSMPDIHPGFPEDWASSTTATTAPPSTERTSVAANTYRASAQVVRPGAPESSRRSDKIEPGHHVDDLPALRVGETLDRQRQAGRLNETEVLGDRRSHAQTSAEFGKQLPQRCKSS